MKTERLKEALPGFGTTGHLTSRLFAQETKLKFDEIPYRGGAPAVTDVLGDHVDFMIGTPQQMMPLVKAGKLKAYAVTQKGKMPEFPTADSMADVLGPQFAIYYWQGLFAPAKTPEAVIKTLNAAVNDAANEPDVLKTVGRHRRGGVPEGHAHAGRGRKIPQERDRALGQGDQGQRHPRQSVTGFAAAGAGSAAAAGKICQLWLRKCKASAAAATVRFVWPIFRPIRSPDGACSLSLKVKQNLIYSIA